MILFLRRMKKGSFNAERLVGRRVLDRLKRRADEISKTERDDSLPRDVAELRESQCRAVVEWDMSG